MKYIVEINEEGMQEWHSVSKNDYGYRLGTIHNLHGPARVFPNGRKEWLVHGQLSRENGPAIEDADGTKEWFKNGIRHRPDGPAIEHPDGSQSWIRFGKLHRVDGPAIINADGSVKYFFEGVQYSEEKFKQMIIEKDGNYYKLIELS